MNEFANYDLHKLVSHRGGMLLLNRVVAASRTHAECEITVTTESSFFQTPNGVPASVGIEYMAQAIAVLGGVQARLDGAPIPVGYLLGTRKYHCAVPWFEDGMVIRACCEEDVFSGNGLGAYHCSLSMGKVLAETRLTVYQKPARESFLTSV